MARYTGPKCKLCRRERTKLFLKGTRCLSPKCAITKRNFIPGQHGPTSRSRLTDFAKHLREKQKAKRIYGLLESQFRKYYEQSALTKGVTGEVLLQTLERRLDNVIYASGFASSRAQARQLVKQGKFLLNNIKVNIPSILTNSGDIIKIAKGKAQITRNEETSVEWTKWNSKKLELQIDHLPTREEITTEINEQLIVEYYSR